MRDSQPLTLSHCTTLDSGCTLKAENRGKSVLWQILRLLVGSSVIAPLYKNHKDHSPLSRTEGDVITIQPEAQ